MINQRILPTIVLAILVGVTSCTSQLITSTSEIIGNDTAPQAFNPTHTPDPITFPADTIFYNGSIITINDHQPRAEALAILNGLIQAVGSDAEILGLQGPDTITIDLQGQPLMPGFVDPHTHIFNDSTRFLGSNNLQLAQQLALRNGITTVGDLWVDPDFLTAIQTMESSGQLHVRTSLYLSYTTPCGELMGDWYQQYQPTREVGEMLRIGGLKIYTDGGVCGSWALSYEIPGMGYGDLWFTQDEMNALVDSLDAAGYQLAIHAMGDRAIEQVLNAVEFVLHGQPNTLRHRIEHNANLRPDLISRYSEIGVVTTIFGSYPAWALEAPPPPLEYQAWVWPYRDLKLANPDVHIAWHGDYPWVGPVSPLLHLYSMVTPYDIPSDDVTECADPSWWTGRTFTVDEVLPMMTIEGAYALFRDNEVGSLEAGKFADLIVLSGDPTTIDPLDIKDLNVWMTMVGGEVQWCAPGHETFCPLQAVNESSANNPLSTPLIAFHDNFFGNLPPDWTWVNADDTRWSLKYLPGFLRMILEAEPSHLLRDVAGKDFQITTHLFFKPESNFQFAGLVIYQDAGTKVQLGRAYCDLPAGCIGNGIYFDAVEGGQSRKDIFGMVTQLTDEAYLRIDKVGSIFTGYYSEDGESWSVIGEHHVLMSDPQVGLVAGQSLANGAIALFDYFTLIELP